MKGNVSGRIRLELWNYGVEGNVDGGTIAFGGEHGPWTVYDLTGEELRSIKESLIRGKFYPTSCSVGGEEGAKR